MSEPKTVIIDRAKWRRGKDKMSDEAGMTKMLNGQGMMCCLGFDAMQACGLQKKDIEHKSSPRSFRKHLPGLNARPLVCTDVAIEAMRVNDDPDITEKDRERRLKKLARQNGRRYEFVGRTPPHLWRRKR